MKPLNRFVLLLATLLQAGKVQVHAEPLEKWIYCQRNLLVDESVSQLDDLMRRGHLAGYTHLVLSDAKTARLGTLGSAFSHYQKNVERVKALSEKYGVEVVPTVFNIGYSNSMLWHDPNLVEGLPVKDCHLVVEKGEAHLEPASYPIAGNFDDLSKWSWKDSNVIADHGTARMDANGKNARIVQKLKLLPWHQYHFSVRVKTKDIKGAKAEVKFIPAHGQFAAHNWANLGVKTTQDWTTHHVVFNTLDQTEFSLFLGTWGATAGTIWWDDAHLEEVAFLNLIRRPGAPLEIKTAEGKSLVEGSDFEPLADKQMGRTPWQGEYDVYHEPPRLRLKANVPDGTKLSASYYHAETIYDGQAMICPSEPKTGELLRDEAQRVHALWGAKAYFMSHDEVRVMNWCAACQKRGLTPGQMLAENVRQCTALLREVAPSARIYVWADMFDPNQNAKKDHYYLVNGDLSGSWEGLDKDVTVVSWYFEKRSEELRWFSDRGLKQVIAGYYDSKPERVADWLSAAKGLPGITGVMYTTWQNRYTDLEKFSEVIEQSANQDIK